jgi:predicted aspartyl protease
MTVSGPYGQYTVDAVVDPDAAYSSVPAAALIEMGIQPVRVVRLKAADGKAHFRQVGRALTTVAGQEDIAPVLFGEPGEPSVIGSATLSVLMLRADSETGSVEQDTGWLSNVRLVEGAKDA